MPPGPPTRSEEAVRRPKSRLSTSVSQSRSRRGWPIGTGGITRAAGVGVTAAGAAVGAAGLVASGAFVGAGGGAGGFVGVGVGAGAGAQAAVTSRASRTAARTVDESSQACTESLGFAWDKLRRSVRFIFYFPFHRQWLEPEVWLLATDYWLLVTVPCGRAPASGRCCSAPPWQNQCPVSRGPAP